MVHRKTELLFRNFLSEKIEEKLTQHWNSHKNKFVDNGDNLIFFYLPGEELEHREKLRAFLNYYRNEESEGNKKQGTHEHANIVVVVEDPSVFMNFRGWEEDIVFCYSLDNMENSMRQLVNRLRCYPFNKNAPVEKIKIKSKGKFDLEDVHDICYCLADGNFTEIHLSNGKRRIESKAISFIDERLGKSSCMGRIGRSYMINRNRIFRVDSIEQKVHFTVNHNCPNRVISFGDTYIKRIREFVYWY